MNPAQLLPVVSAARQFVCALLLTSLVPAATAAEQVLHCVGQGWGVDLDQQVETTPVAAEFKLRVRHDDTAHYLALGSEAYIEAPIRNGEYQFSGVTNMLGKRSMRFHPETGAIRYKSLLTVGNTGRSRYIFEGVCKSTDPV